MADQARNVSVRIDGDPALDAEELEILTRRLRSELLEIDDVRDVEPVRAGPAPAGAKAFDPVTPGALLVTLAASGGVLTTLIGLLQSWATRNERRGVTVELGDAKLVLSGVSSAEQRRMVDLWLETVSDRGDAAVDGTAAVDGRPEDA